MKKFVKILGLFLLFVRSTLAQEIHIFTVGNTKTNQYFVNWAKKSNFEVLHQEITQAQQLVEALTNTKFKNSDRIMLVYSGKIDENGYFEMDGLKFNQEYFDRLLKNKPFSLSIQIFNTDLNNNFSPKFSPELFKDMLNVSVLCQNLDVFAQNLENSKWTDTDSPQLKIKTKEKQILTGNNQYDLVPFTVLKPTASIDIPKPTLQNCKNLGDVNKILRKALTQARYKEHRYYRMPNGFALVARMEKIDHKGSPYKEPERWQIGIQLNNPLDYINAIFAAPKGYYRVIAFIVTDELFNSNTPATEEKVNAWFSRTKITELPTDVAAFPYKKDKPQQVVAFIYEFKTGDIGEKPTLLTEGNGSPESAVEHLTAAGLWKFLNTK